MARQARQARFWIAISLVVIVASAGVALLVRARTAAPVAARAEDPPGSLGAAAALAVEKATVVPYDVAVGRYAELDCTAGGKPELAFTWKTSDGAIVPGKGCSARWYPGRPGPAVLLLEVSAGAAQASRSISVSAYLRRPIGDANRPQPQLPPDVDRDAARLAAKARVAALREIVTAHGREGEEAYAALKELAPLLATLQENEEARFAYLELRGRAQHQSPEGRGYAFGHGQAAFALGSAAEAKDAFEAASGAGLSAYYLGDIHERAGQVDGAIKSFEDAAEANRLFADPLLRLALLQVQRRAPPAQVQALLAGAIARSSRERILDRLRSDDALRALERFLPAGS
jgi:hypothetical protein